MPHDALGGSSPTPDESSRERRFVLVIDTNDVRRRSIMEAVRLASCVPVPWAPCGTCEAWVERSRLQDATVGFRALILTSTVMWRHVGLPFLFDQLRREPPLPIILVEDAPILGEARGEVERAGIPVLGGALRIRDDITRMLRGETPLAGGVVFGELPPRYP